MNTIDFSVKIIGIPAKEYNELMEALRRNFLEEFGIVFDPSNNVEIHFSNKDFTIWESCRTIVAHSLTNKVLQDEIKNGN